MREEVVKVNLVVCQRGNVEDGDSHYVFALERIRVCLRSAIVARYEVCELGILLRSIGTRGLMLGP